MVTGHSTKSIAAYATRSSQVKELLHEECEPNLHTKQAIEDARQGRLYNDYNTLIEESE